MRSSALTLLQQAGGRGLDDCFDMIASYGTCYLTLEVPGAIRAAGCVHLAELSAIAVAWFEEERPVTASIFGLVTPVHGLRCKHACTAAYLCYCTC